MSPGANPPTTVPNVPSGLPPCRPAALPACRPVAQGEFRHAVREWCTVCRCHADGRGDLPDARPRPVRLHGRGVHRAHGRPCRPPGPPHSRLTLRCLQAAPGVAGPVTTCAFPTDSRERLACSHSMGVKPDVSKSMGQSSHCVVMICNLCNYMTSSSSMIYYYFFYTVW